MSNTVSPQVKLVNNLGRGYRERDMDLIAKTFHKDFRHIVYPKSLNIPEQSRKEYLDYIEKRISHWVEAGSPTIDVVVDIPGKVVVHVSNTSKTDSGSSITYESIFVAHIVTEADGSLKIKQAEAFVDSKSHELDPMAIA